MIDEDEIYGLHCDIGRLENEKKHWHTEFINEQEYAHIMEERAEKAEAENVKLRKLLQDLAICACGKYCYGCPHQYDGCDRDKRLREMGIGMNK